MIQNHVKETIHFVSPVIEPFFIPAEGTNNVPWKEPPPVGITGNKAGDTAFELDWEPLFGFSTSTYLLRDPAKNIKAISYNNLKVCT